MIPYFIMSNVTHALFVSIAVTVVVLILFGFAKNYQNWRCGYGFQKMWTQSHRFSVIQTKSLSNASLSKWF